MPEFDELLRQLQDSAKAIIALLGPGETEVDRGMGSFIASLGFDKDVILHFLKARGLISHINHPRIKSLWRVDQSMQITKQWLRSQIAAGRVPHEYVRRSRTDEPGLVGQLQEQASAAGAEVERLGGVLAQIAELAAPEGGEAHHRVIEALSDIRAIVRDPHGPVAPRIRRILTDVRELLPAED